MNILAFSGSLRKDSFNTALLDAFVAAAPEDVSIERADISTLPLFNEDAEAAFPQAAADLKAKIRAADGLLIATPEYNRSIPGVLKNAIDWTSRPYGDNAWDGKPVYVIGASIGPVSAAIAQYDLKKVMLYLNAHVLGQPEFHLGLAQGKFDAAGVLTDEDSKGYVRKALEAFVSHIRMVTARPS